jgi:hypothetical protein
LSADLIYRELSWQRQLMAALLLAEPRPGWAIEATRRRIEALLCAQPDAASRSAEKTRPAL